MSSRTCSAGRRGSCVGSKHRQHKATRASVEAREPLASGIVSREYPQEDPNMSPTVRRVTPANSPWIAAFSLSRESLLSCYHPTWSIQGAHASGHFRAPNTRICARDHFIVCTSLYFVLLRAVVISRSHACVCLLQGEKGSRCCTHRRVRGIHASSLGGPEMVFVFRGNADTNDARPVNE